ncbi:MAG: helix-turn-helix domain-containing protein [Clostridiales bacterium]
MTNNLLLTTQKNINDLLRDFSLAFHISCYFYDVSGQQLGYYCYNNRSNFCRFVGFFDSKQICRQYYMQSCAQAHETQSPHISFCPFGLINITFPIAKSDNIPYFVTAGPLLFHEPDDLIVKNILDLNYLFKPRAREMRQRLNEVTVKPKAEVQSIITIMSSSLRDVKGVPQNLTGINSEDEQISLKVSSWLKNRNNEEDQYIYDVLIKELEMLEQYPIDGSNTETLNSIIETFMKYIYKNSTFEVIQYRAVKYIELIIEIAHKMGIHLEIIFNPQGENIDKIMNATELQPLKDLLSETNKRFINHYLSNKELTNRDIIFQAMHYIRMNYSDISLGDVAHAVSLNPAYLSNLFKKETGTSYSNYLNKIRIEEAKRLLRQNYSISETAQEVGFSDQSYFTNVFRKYEGISPNRWRNNQID